MNVFGWGANWLGSLGTGRLDQNLTTATETLYGADVVSIATGPVHSLVLKADGSIWVVGDNSFGELGTGTGATLIPIPVPLAGRFVAVVAGTFYSLAVRDDGTVWAWGSNFFGQLGDGTNTNRISPVQVSGLAGVVAIAASCTHPVENDFSLALKSDHTVWAWGSNQFAQLGDGTSASTTTPVQVKIPPLIIRRRNGITEESGQAVAIAAGGFHGMALTFGGDVWTWGNNQQGQLGDRTVTRRNIPVRVKGSATAIAAGLIHSLALDQDGTIWAWGANGEGQLAQAIGMQASTPTRTVFGSGAAVALAAGQFHNLAINPSGQVFSWGKNDAGQLGDGTLINKDGTSIERAVPALVVAPIMTRRGRFRLNPISNVTRIAAGGAESFALWR